MGWWLPQRLGRDYDATVPPSLLSVRQPVAKGYTAALQAARGSTGTSSSSSSGTAAATAASAAATQSPPAAAASAAGAVPPTGLEPKAPSLSPVLPGPRGTVGLELRAPPPPPHLRPLDDTLPEIED